MSSRRTFLRKHPLGKAVIAIKRHQKAYPTPKNKIDKFKNLSFMEILRAIRKRIPRWETKKPILNNRVRVSPHTLGSQTEMPYEELKNG